MQRSWEIPCCVVPSIDIIRVEKNECHSMMDGSNQTAIWNICCVKKIICPDKTYTFPKTFASAYLSPTRGQKSFPSTLEKLWHFSQASITNEQLGTVWEQLLPRETRAFQIVSPLFSIFHSLFPHFCPERRGKGRVGLGPMAELTPGLTQIYLEIKLPW